MLLFIRYSVLILEEFLEVKIQIHIFEISHLKVMAATLTTGLSNLGLREFLCN